jgi:hypothetical protein
MRRSAAFAERARLVLVSDGQAWSGEVEQSIARPCADSHPRRRRGTTAGGIIPTRSGSRQDILVSSLDRDRSVIGRQAAGVLELDREPDSDIANAIIAVTRAGHRRAERDRRRTLLGTRSRRPAS